VASLRRMVLVVSRYVVVGRSARSCRVVGGYARPDLPPLGRLRRQATPRLSDEPFHHVERQFRFPMGVEVETGPVVMPERLQDGSGLRRAEVREFQRHAITVKVRSHDDLEEATLVLPNVHGAMLAQPLAEGVRNARSCREVCADLPMRARLDYGVSSATTRTSLEM
jgi:hypothetical protein